MTSICIHFPDGSKEFRYPKIKIREGDVLIHDGVRYRVTSVSDNGDGRDAATVQLIPEGILDMLSSEEGAVHLLPDDSFDPSHEGI